MPNSEYKPDVRPNLRSKSVFGDDITKRMNEPATSRHDYTTLTSNISVEIPKYLKKPTAFTHQISEYE
jgi:hypothetical protein